MEAMGEAVPHLPWRLVRLENGLTLLMLPEETAMEVGVELWIRGGAREEGRGEFGVAHVFEHFVPSSGRFASNVANRSLRSRTRRGGNAGVELDFLRFYDRVAPDGLAASLAALADRLESDPERFIDGALRREQEVVVSELRRSVHLDWDPEVQHRLHRGTFGPDHPYGHGVAGLEVDVLATTVDGMREWHRRFAGPADALLLMAGNFDPVRAEAVVRRYFGPIPPRPRAPRLTEWVPSARTVREVIEKDVPYGAVYLQWPAPSWGSAGGDHLALLARILNRRLRQRADKDELLDDVAAEVSLWEAAGAFSVRGRVRCAEDVPAVEAVLRSELDRLLEDGAEIGELAAARNALRTDFVRALQQLGWRGGRTEALGLGLLYRDDPNHYRVRLERIAAATPPEVNGAGRRWLASPGYVLHVLPRPERAAVGSLDRSAAVEAGVATPPSLPRIQAHTLPGGMRLLVVERGRIPLVEVALVFRAGIAREDATTAGAARVVLEAIPRAPAGPDGVTLRDALSALGSEVSTRLDEDLGILELSVLPEHLTAAISLLLGAASREIPTASLEASRHDVRRRLGGAISDPVQLRERALACLLQSPGPCAPGALDGLGTVEALDTLSPSVLRHFHRAFYVPGAAALVVSGDVSADELAAIAERATAGWVGTGRRGGRQEHTRPRASGGDAIVLIGHADAPQSNLIVAIPFAAEHATDPLATAVLAWTLRQRLMANLRDGKGWSYEVWPFGVHARAGGAMLRFDVPVRTEHTAAAITEIAAEMRRLREEPVEHAFLETVRGLVRSRATEPLTLLRSMNDHLVEIARSGLPLDHTSRFLSGLDAFTAEDLAVAADRYLGGDVLWIVSGEREVLEAPLRALGAGEVQVWGEGRLRW